MDPQPCPHSRTRWDDLSQFLICASCGQEFPKGTCLRCSQPAVSSESFSCGKPCQPNEVPMGAPDLIQTGWFTGVDGERHQIVDGRQVS